MSVTRTFVRKRRSQKYPSPSSAGPSGSRSKTGRAAFGRWRSRSRARKAIWGGPAYYLALARITAALQPKQVVEFGTFLGFAATIFAMNAPQGRILTIDLPDNAGDLSNLNNTDVEHVRSSRNRVGQCYKGTPYESRISELKTDSRELVLRSHVESADLILVDGGHDTGCVTADTKNAFAVARPGTVILWDDYFWLYPDVVGFLDGLADRHKLFRIEQTSVVGHVVG